MGSLSTDDPRCPECGGAIGMTAAHCMHCSADLTEKRERVDDEGSNTSRPSSTSRVSDPIEDTSASGGSLLDPDGLLNNLLTVVVGIIGGFVIGFIGWYVVTSVFLVLLELETLSIILGLLAGILVWLGATAYLVQRRSVQEAISKAAYGTAIAIMTIPLVVFSQPWDTSSQVLSFVGMAVVCGILAVIIAGIGLLAGRSVPESDPE